VRHGLGGVRPVYAHASHPPRSRIAVDALAARPVATGKSHAPVGAAGCETLAWCTPARCIDSAPTLPCACCRAAAAGISALFIAGGIHREDVVLQGGPEGGNAAAAWDTDALAELCSRHGVHPAAAMAFMQW